MSLLTTLTRMWLTRSVKPFAFKAEYDETLPFEELSDLGLYVHLPFCRRICSFCPYLKVKYEKEQAESYVDSLIKEIHLVGRSIKTKEKKKVTSLYFGGGTPALLTDRISDIISALEEYFIITEGVGIELHPENVDEVTLAKLQKAGVTKLSIGIQSFQNKNQKILGRKPVNASELKNVLEKFHFETVSMDLIFALPEQTLEDLKKDIDTVFENGANHVAIYPFIDFTFTKSKVTAAGKREKRRLLDEITLYLQEKGYHRDSIWTFSKGEKPKYSSMTRNNFLGFGCSATTLLKKQFKVNTFDIKSYEKRVAEGKLPTSLTIRFTRRQRMVYYLFWTLYSTRLDEREFEKFFGVPLSKMYGLEFFLGRLFGFLKKEDGVYSFTLKGAFYYHYYENFYTLSYIDKMWGIMREEAFPKGIRL